MTTTYARVTLKGAARARMSALSSDLRKWSASWLLSHFAVKHVRGQ